MPYRIEVCPNNRATCCAKPCKDAGVKILKGEIRQAVMVTFQEKQSWKYRHWGCVTPAVLHNWKESSEMNMELVDGFNDLPEDAQATVLRALEQEHVDDDVWKGDVEMNRYNPKKPHQGMFAPAGRKKKEGEDADVEGTEPEASPVKKRGRGKAKADDDDVEPAPKKAKRSSKKATKQDEDDGHQEPAKTTKRNKKTIEGNERELPADRKRGRGKKDSSEPELGMNTDEGDEAITPAPKKGRPRKAKPEPETDGKSSEPPSTKTSSGKKSKATATDGDADDVELAKPQSKRKGRGRKAATAEEE